MVIPSEFCSSIGAPHGKSLSCPRGLALEVDHYLYVRREHTDFPLRELSTGQSHLPLTYRVILLGNHLGIYDKKYQ